MQAGRGRRGDEMTAISGAHALQHRVLPPLARRALDRYLVERGLPVTPSKWRLSTPLIVSLGDEGGITAWRLWRVMKRFFATAAVVVEDGSPALAEKACHRFQFRSCLERRPRPPQPRQHEAYPVAVR